MLPEISESPLGSTLHFVTISHLSREPSDGRYVNANYIDGFKSWVSL